jgi:hypothetical protein
MSELIVFDSSVLLANLRTGRYREQLGAVQGFVRNSSVVLAKMWRASTTDAEREFVRALSRNHPVLTPTEAMWLESGQVLGKLEKLGTKPDELRSLHLDVLIGLTVRAHGARLISGHGQSGMVRIFVDFEIEFWWEGRVDG